MSRRRRWFSSSILFVAFLASEPRALAQRDPSTAEALFVAGRDAALRGDYATACARFAESDRLDPAPGTRINLADCEEHLGHPAAAWAHWKEAIDLLEPTDPRLSVTRERASAAEKRVPRLTLKLAAPPPSGLRIKKDEIELGPAALGVALPDEPGEHTLVVLARGHRERRTTITLAEGEARTVVLELGDPEPTAAPEPAPAPLPAPETKPAEAAPESGSGRRTLGWIGLGVGAAGIGIGTVTGIMAIDRKSTLETNCHPAGVCNAEGGDAASSGRTLATVSTIAFVAGGVAVITGAFLLFTSKSSPATKTALAPFPTDRGGGVGLRGSF